MEKISNKTRFLSVILLSAIMVFGISTPSVLAATETESDQAIVASSTEYEAALSALTDEQISFIIAVLEAFGVDEATLVEVETALVK
ncbi:MAG: hypothetical protein WC887_03150 [Candidatus Paceibacterota bacterium]|jgi:hypothetical protein